MMKLNLVETETVFYDVVCSNPEEDTRRYTFCVENTDEFNPWDDESCNEYHDSIVAAINERVNHYGYWTDVIITAVYIIDGKPYRVEI